MNNKQIHQNRIYLIIFINFFVFSYPFLIVSHRAKMRTKRFQLPSSPIRSWPVWRPRPRRLRVVSGNYQIQAAASIRPGHNLTSRVSNLLIATKWELSAQADTLQPTHSNHRTPASPSAERAVASGVGLTFLLWIFSHRYFRDLKLCYNFPLWLTGSIELLKAGTGLCEQPPSYHTDTVSQILLCSILNTLPAAGI